MNEGEDTRDTCPPVKRTKLGEEEGSETHTKGWLVQWNQGSLKTGSQYDAGRCVASRQF